MTEPNQSPIVVVADDDEDARTLLAEGLRAAGCVTYEASNGGALLACVQLLLAREQKVALVLSDVHMPEADGISAAAQLMALDPSLHVVLMSAFADPAVLERASAAGVSRVLHKPFGRNVLLEVLESECRQQCAM